MVKLHAAERQLAAVTARVIVKATEVGLPDSPDKLVSEAALRILARAHSELLDQIRALHDRVDLTDPNDPIGVALTQAGLEVRPPELLTGPEPHLVRTPTEISTMTVDDLLALYCRVMHESSAALATPKTFVVRVWDGMDGCWTDCTGEVTLGEALRYWAEKTDGGTKRVAYAEIDYYRIFPGGTRMMWDGSEGREMHR